MSIEQAGEERAEFSVENIGGIKDTHITISPGITLLTGRNATNRTSFLQAVMAICGSDDVSIKGDASEAHVTLEFGDETYTRMFKRDDGTIRSSGEPYLEDSMLADLFAFLLESNEARQAVVRGDDLRELIMRPVDTAEIKAKIDSLVEERNRIDDKLDEIDAAKRELPSIEEERARLESEIKKKRNALKETEAEIESLDADVSESREKKSELEQKLDELQSKRSDLEDVRYELETEQATLAELRKERTELEEKITEFSETPADEISDIEDRIDRLRAEKRSVEADINELQSLIGFNEDMLEDTNGDVIAALDDDFGADALTDQLLEGTTVNCWTCGTEVQTEQIESTVDNLRELSQQKVAELNDIQDELDTLSDRKQELRQQQQSRETVQQELDRVRNRISDRDENIDRLKERREKLREEIETAEETIADLEDESRSEVLELHREANQLEYDLGQLETDLEQVESRIADIEERLAERDDLERQREELSEELERLRTQIERIETEALDKFNTHMETLLELLDYDNLDRIWLERVEKEDRSGRGTTSKPSFDLHVVRKSDSGVTYEDTIDHLSESEREVTGLVFCLAGYLAHEVYETVPFMLLDSLEAIDAERLATLVEYIDNYSEFLIVAILTEDAQALDDEYQRVTEI